MKTEPFMKKKKKIHSKLKNKTSHFKTVSFEVRTHDGSIPHRLCAFPSGYLPMRSHSQILNAFRGPLVDVKEPESACDYDWSSPQCLTCWMETVTCVPCLICSKLRRLLRKLGFHLDYAFVLVFWQFVNGFRTVI